jgi:hypothetical protein
MLAAGCKRGLDLQCSLVISIGGGYCGKRPQPVGHLPVVVGVSGGVAEFECDRVAERNLSPRSKWCKCRGDGRLGQPCEDAGVDQISDACHLFVGTPRSFGVFEVESAFLAEQGDQLQPTPGVDDLAQGSIDRRPQGRRTEYLSGLLQDVWINFDRCLWHVPMISGAGMFCAGLPHNARPRT